MTTTTPSGLKLWVLGARPRTLPAAIVPVAVGTAAAYYATDTVIAWRAAAALVVSLAVQIGTNYVNDYADGVRGTDDVRVGPIRLVGQKLASASAVKRAAILSFAVAAAAGLALCAVAGWQLALVGAAAILAGWFYTGGPRPYGYAGLGEAFVFVFFGLVATAGSTYVQLERVTRTSVAAGVCVGLWATALLVVNNLRDRLGDKESGKKTLAVRIGNQPTRVLYVLCVFGGIFGGIFMTPLTVVAAPIAARATRKVMMQAEGRDLIAVLQSTALVQLVGGIGLTIGLVIR